MIVRTKTTKTADFAQVSDVMLIENLSVSYYDFTVPKKIWQKQTKPDGVSATTGPRDGHDDN